MADEADTSGDLRFGKITLNGATEGVRECERVKKKKKRRKSDST